MGDTLTNALRDAGRSSSVLEGIAHPAVLNPLAGMGSAIQTVQGMQGLAANQGKQLVGQALQQATDENGVLDTAKAQSIAAGMGPNAAYAMQDFLKTSSQLRGEQIAQVAGLYKLGGAAAASLMRDPSDANLEQVRQSLVTAGAPPSFLQEVDRLKTLSPAQRVIEAHDHIVTALDGQDQLARSGYGTPVMTQFGGTSAPVVTTPGSPRGPGGVTVGGGIPHAPGPEQYYSPQSAPIMYDANGQVTTDPTKAVTQAPRDAPRGPLFNMPPPGSIGAPGGGPPAAVPASGSLPPNAPPPPAGTTLQGGHFVQRPPAPASSGAPAQPPTVTPPAPTGGVVTGLPTGAEKATETDIGAYKTDQAAQPDVQRSAQNMAHAYDALQQLKSATGRGAEGINNLRSWAQTLGILPAGAVDEQKLFEIVHKYTERAMIDAAGGGSTDLGRRMQEQANAGTLLSTPANLDILRNDMGNRLQTIAAYKDHANTSGTGYLAARAKIADSTDPRGFVWNLYSPEEQAKINAEVDKDPVAAAKLHKAIGMAQRLQLQIPGLSAQPPRQKQSFLAPPAPEVNALQMTG